MQRKECPTNSMNLSFHEPRLFSFITVLPVAYIYLLASSQWEPLRPVVTVFIQWLAGSTVACHLPERMSCGVFFSTHQNSSTCKHTNIHVFTVSICLFPPVFRAHMGSIYAFHIHPVEPLCLSSLFLFFHFSTSALSSFASSCVIQQRNISSTRPAINMPAHPRLLGLLFFL